MAFKKDTTSNSNETFENVEKVVYNYTINRVREVIDTMVSFNIIVNGVTIYGMKVIKFTKDGQERMMVAFPSQKGNNEKYYNHAFFPMSNEMQADIIAQVLSAL